MTFLCLSFLFIQCAIRSLVLEVGLWELYQYFGLKIEYIVLSWWIRGKFQFISSKRIRGFLFSLVMDFSIFIILVPSYSL